MYYKNERYINTLTFTFLPFASICLPRKDESLSWPGWLTYSGRYTCHQSAAGRAQDRGSSPVKDQRSTTVPRNQLKGKVPRLIFELIYIPRINH